VSLLREVSRFVSELRRERYDVALDFQANFKGAVHGIVSGARRRVGFARPHSRELSHLFTHDHVFLPDTPIHRVDTFLHLAAFLGVPTNGIPYALPDSPESRERIRAFLERNRLREGGYVTIHPGTSEFGRSKRWDPDRFGLLAERIGGKHRLLSVVTWGPGERDLARRVVERSGGQAVLAMQTESLLDLAEILRRSRLFVGCDSGPMHLASAVEIPSVALFGPKDPKVYGPRSPKSRVVFKPQGDGPNGAMDAITVEDVCAAVDELLA
jgi:ADP-heptose:LPS heptosyltransferase